MSGAPKPRRTASLAKSLDQQLNLYTLAARASCRLTYAAAVGVAGAAVMSLAPIAEAKIIYTPAHVQIRPNSRGLAVSHCTTCRSTRDVLGTKFASPL
jgi:hypothetical protein